jgi:hypothetical protein
MKIINPKNDLFPWLLTATNKYGSVTLIAYCNRKPLICEATEILKKSDCWQPEDTVTIDGGVGPFTIILDKL